MRKHAHITVNGRPMCQDSSLASLRRAEAVVAANTGVDLPPVQCGQASVKNARRVAQALRPHFARGVCVAVVVGECPELSL